MTSILILNYNGTDHLRKCLLSIQGFTDVSYELIVIDNGSTDGAQEYLRTVDARNLTVVQNPENLGCPPARAQGMALASGEYVVFLDNDTVVTPGWLRRLVGHAEKDPAIGLLGPSTNYISGSQMLKEVSYDTTAEMVRVARGIADKAAGVLEPVLRLVGFCLFIRRAVIDKVGSCDPSFGKYGFEDDDFSLRAALAGFDAYIARDVFIHHTGSRGHVEGGLDYSCLVREAWSVFQEKWSIPADMRFGEYSLEQVRLLHDRPFDPETDFVPLPLAADVEPLVTRRT